MAFNPEDFVFEPVDLPKNDPTILEYDALRQIIIVRLGESNDTAENKQGDYRMCQLSDQLNENLLNHLPDKFSNRNDKIIMFWVTLEGKYGLVKEKLKYDFKTQESNWVRYDYNKLTDSEVKELFDVIKTAVWTQNYVARVKEEKTILQLARREEYLGQLHADRAKKRDYLLRTSDFRVLPDAPSTFEGELSAWVKWRVEVRNCVKSPVEFEDPDDYLLYNLEFKWPITPTEWHETDPDTEYLSVDSHYTESFKTDISPAALEDINNSVKQIFEYAKRRREGAVATEEELADSSRAGELLSDTPMPKKMRDIINRYNLLYDITEIQPPAGE